MKLIRDTPEALFNAILGLIKSNDQYAAESIMEYASPERYDKREFTDYRFDFLPSVYPGTNEGIIVSCTLRGKFDDSGEDTCQIGVFKTTSDHIEAYRIMGELCGLLAFYASEYINREIDRYSPK